MKTAKDQYHQNIKLFKAARSKLGLSLRQIQSLVGVHYCAISRFENGKHIDVLHYISLCQFIAMHSHSY